MVANPSNQFDPVGKLDEVIVGPQGERLGLDHWLFLARQDDQRYLARPGVGTQELDQLQTIDIRHDQVLEDDRGLHGVGHGQSPDRVLAKVQDNITLRIQHAPDGLADDGLVVDQQNRHGSGIRPVGQSAPELEGLQTHPWDPLFVIHPLRCPYRRG